MNENTTEPRVETIKNATPDEGRTGDHLIRESIRTEDGVTHTIRREGTAHHRDRFGNWRTVEHGWLTDGQGEGHGVTLTIRRTVRELPTTQRTVIIPNDGHDVISAVMGGVTYHTREAVYLGWGLWQGAWRSTDDVRLHMSHGCITLDTWKEDGK